MVIVLQASVMVSVLGMTIQAHGAWTVQTLKSFVAYTSSGDSPMGTLVQGNDGALYGLTVFGGDSGGGTAFKVNCDGSGFTILHAFLWYRDGENPHGGLLQATNGNLYGETMYSGGHGVGTLFTLNPDGSHFAVIHSFGAGASDGAYPVSGVLVQGRDGALYGTTAHGGTNNQGIVFKINLDGGSYAVLHTFAADDGYGLAPDAGVIQASDGFLYGTTPQGGTNGCGTVYKLSTNGSGYSIIHIFGLSGDVGHNPYCALVQGADGALYGTTGGGGDHYEGTVFRLNPDGTDYSVIYSFNESGPDPHTPQAGLVQGTDGYLYGTGYGGGSAGSGAVFTINTNGADFAVLYSFVESYGSSPSATLIFGQDGALYGTTLSGGSDYSGTVFRLAPPARPQVGMPSFFPDGSFRFSLIAPAGKLCRIDISTNLADWNTLTNVTSGTNAVQVIDNSVTTFTRRFYRASYSPSTLIGICCRQPSFCLQHLKFA